MTKKKTLGIILGLAIGVLIDSSLVVGLYVLVVFSIPILLIPPFFGIIYGLKLSNVESFPETNWPLIVLVGLTALTFATIAPYYISVFELRLHSSEIPVPQNSSKVLIGTNPFGSSMGGPFVSKHFETRNNWEEISSFYSLELAENGWQQFSQSEYKAWFIKPRKHMIIVLVEKQNNNHIKVTYNHDSIWGPWVVLVATIVCLLIAWRQYGRSNI